MSTCLYTDMCGNARAMCVSFCVSVSAHLYVNVICMFMYVLYEMVPHRVSTWVTVWSMCTKTDTYIAMLCVRCNCVWDVCCSVFMCDVCAWVCECTTHVHSYCICLYMCVCLYGMFVRIWKVDGEMSNCVCVSIPLCKDTRLGKLSLDSSVNKRRQLYPLWVQKGRFKTLIYGSSILASLLSSHSTSCYHVIWKLKCTINLLFLFIFPMWKDWHSKLKLPNKAKMIDTAQEQSLISFFYIKFSISLLFDGQGYGLLQ